MPKKPTSDSSSDSEDEATKRMLREATDSTLLTNAMFSEPVPADNKSASKQKTAIQPDGATTKPLIPVAPTVAATASNGRKSQRYIDVDERLENDMQVTESMQTFMHKKLNQILEKQIEFVENTVDDPEAEEVEDESSVFTLQLFSGSAPIVLSRKAIENVSEHKVEAALPKGPQKKPKARKRRHLDDDTPELSEAQKITESVVSTEAIATEVSAWSNRSKPDRLYCYKEHASKTNYLIEPTTEFTAQRKRNNWSENKIARPKAKK